MWVSHVSAVLSPTVRAAATRTARPQRRHRLPSWLTGLVGALAAVRGRVERHPRRRALHLLDGLGPPQAAAGPQAHKHTAHSPRVRPATGAAVASAADVASQCEAPLPERSARPGAAAAGCLAQGGPGGGVRPVSCAPWGLPEQTMAHHLLHSPPSVPLLAALLVALLPLHVSGASACLAQSSVGQTGDSALESGAPCPTHRCPWPALR